MKTTSPSRYISLFALLAFLGGGLAQAQLPAPAGEEGCPPPRTLKKCGELGERYYESGQYDRAIHAFRDAYVINPLPVFLYDIALAHRMAGHHQEAMRLFERYLQEDPNTGRRAEVQRHLSELQREEAERTAALRREEANKVATLRQNAVKAPVIAHPAQYDQGQAPRRASTPTPVHRKWWFWTALGVLAAGAATAGIVAAAYHPTPEVPTNIEIFSPAWQPR